MQLMGELRKYPFLPAGLSTPVGWNNCVTAVGVGKQAKIDPEIWQGIDHRCTNDDSDS